MTQIELIFADWSIHLYIIIRYANGNNKNKNDEYSGYDRVGIGINRL